MHSKDAIFGSFGGGVAAECCGQAADQGETEAGMPTTAVAGAVGAPELPKCHSRLLRGQRAPGIGHGHVGRSVGFPLAGHPDSPARVGIFDAVLEDIRKDNRHAIRVRNDDLVVADVVLERL